MAERKPPAGRHTTTNLPPARFMSPLLFDVNVDVREALANIARLQRAADRLEQTVDRVIDKLQQCVASPRLTISDPPRKTG